MQFLDGDILNFNANFSRFRCCVCVSISLCSDRLKHFECVAGCALIGSRGFKKVAVSPMAGL
jgi:hypothetical protein